MLDIRKTFPMATICLSNFTFAHVAAAPSFSIGLRQPRIGHQ
jgi:hypothetical protein